jgi:hypothetical protein
MGNNASSPKQEQYLQTFFKAQLNSVLRQHGKSRFNKLPPGWSSIAKRLVGVSINTMSTLRHDFHHGWENWDGSEFSTLPKSLRNSSGSKGNNNNNNNIQSDPATSTPFIPELKFKPLVRADDTVKVSRSKTLKEDYHPEDGEYTAAKSVSDWLQ